MGGWGPVAPTRRQPQPLRWVQFARRGSLPRRFLHPVPVLLPPISVPGRHVVPLRPLPHRPVDEFAYDVGVADVAVTLGDHVDQDAVEGEFGVRGPGDAAHGVQGESVEGLVRVGAGPAVAVDDLLAGLLGGRPQVGVRFGGAGDPQRLGTGERPAEGLAEVDRLGTGEVLDQSQEVGAGRGQGAADVVLGEALDLQQQGVAGVLEVEAKVGGGVLCGHRISLSAAQSLSTENRAGTPSTPWPQSLVRCRRRSWTVRRHRSRTTRFWWG